MQTRFLFYTIHFPLPRDQELCHQLLTNAQEAKSVGDFIKGYAGEMRFLRLAGMVVPESDPQQSEAEVLKFVAKDKEEFPLIEAVLKGNRELLQHLVAECVPHRRTQLVNVKDHHGRSALRCCLDPLRMDMTMILLRAGADPGCHDRDGNTLLHHLCSRGDIDAATKLLRMRADPNRKNHKGRLPYQMCDEGVEAALHGLMNEVVVVEQAKDNSE
jgi:hypothetical protein